MIAVSVVCVVIGLYVGSLSEVVGESGSERRVEEATMEGIWRDISEDGVFEAGTGLERAISPTSIPDGYAVAVEVTVVTAEGTEHTAGRARLGEPGASDAPEDAQRVSRPVSVKRSEGDIRPGRLVVEVWQ